MGSEVQHLSSDLISSCVCKQEHTDKFEFGIKLNITLPSHLTCEPTTILNCSQ